MLNKATKRGAAAPKKSRKKPAEITDEQLKIELAKRLPLRKLADLYSKEESGGAGN